MSRKMLITLATGLVLMSLATMRLRAEIERTGYPTDHGIELMWWPKVAPPKGWFQDRDVSMQNAINMLVPNGETYQDSPAVMYARAFYHEKGDTAKELAATIAHDHRNFLDRDPKMKIAEIAALPTGDGAKLRTFAFSPSDDGNWELVAYGREPEYVLMFCISARSATALEKYRPAFAAMVASYVSRDEGGQ